MELFINNKSTLKIINSLDSFFENKNLIIQLFDSSFLYSFEKSIACWMYSLSSQIFFERKYFPIISKIDLMTQFQDDPCFNLDYYLNLGYFDLPKMFLERKRDLAPSNKLLNILQKMIGLIESYGKCKKTFRHLGILMFLTRPISYL